MTPKELFTYPVTKTCCTSQVFDTPDGPQMLLSVYAEGEAAHYRLPLAEARDIAAAINQYDAVYRGRKGYQPFIGDASIKFFAHPLAGWHSTSRVVITPDGPQMLLALHIGGEPVRCRLPLAAARHVMATISDAEQLYRGLTNVQSDSPSDPDTSAPAPDGER